MHLAVLEERPLHELAPGYTVLLPDRTVTYGPSPPLHCAAVLEVWHDTGWLELAYVEPPAQWDLIPGPWRQRLTADGALARDDAHSLLTRPGLAGHGDRDRRGRLLPPCGRRLHNGSARPRPSQGAIPRAGRVSMVLLGSP
jgi:hypothetical protein